jgi:hypothetical protein
MCEQAHFFKIIVRRKEFCAELKPHTSVSVEVQVLEIATEM